MNIQEMLENSYLYSKEALWGKWRRWLTLTVLSGILTLCVLAWIILLAMLMFPKPPASLSSNDMHHLLPTGIGWELIAILILGILVLSIALGGYSVRIYRGLSFAPDLAPWGELLVDGLRVTTVSFIWSLPAIVIISALGMIGLAVVSRTSDTLVGISLIAILFLLVLLPIAVVVAHLYGVIGRVRFARTGSIREGLRFGVINEHINNIGWKVYIGSLVMLYIVALVVVGVFAVFENAPCCYGWIPVLILTPLWMIFNARYIALLYDRGIKEPVPAKGL